MNTRKLVAKHEVSPRKPQNEHKSINFAPCLCLLFTPFETFSVSKLLVSTETSILSEQSNLALTTVVFLI
jgi:hypothetical protein